LLAALHSETCSTNTNDVILVLFLFLLWTKVLLILVAFVSTIVHQHFSELCLEAGIVISGLKLTSGGSVMYNK